MTITLPTYALRIDSDWLSATREAVALDHFIHPFFVWFSFSTILFLSVCVYIYVCVHIYIYIVRILQGRRCLNAYANRSEEHV